MPVTVHNVQTDREAPMGPPTSIDQVRGPSVPCPGGQVECTVQLQPSAAQPAPGEGPAYFAPGHSIHLLYESQWPVPDTMKPSSFTWMLVTDEGGIAAPASGVQLDVPS